MNQEHAARIAQLEMARPALDDHRRAAKRRIPRVAWEYLDSGVAAESGLARDRAGWEAVTLTPRHLADISAPDTAREIFGRRYVRPFGVAPIGLASLLWPGAEIMLAKAARAAGGIFTLSTVAGESIEAVGDAAPGSWFQLYAPNDAEMRADIVARAQAAGFGALLVTCDVPIPSRRERQRRAGVGMPPKMTPAMIADLLMHPHWLAATLRRGVPTFETLVKYATPEDMRDVAAFVGRRINQRITPEILAELRRQWDGPLVVKGVLGVEDARAALEAGADGVVVSTHGARQFDAAPSSAEALVRVKEAVGDRMTVLADSGLRSGHDLARAYALGADACLLGRPFIWAAASAGAAGAAHAFHALGDELTNVMHQLGAGRLDDLPGRLGQG
ncbi:alpha-hydroxy acid oxidase [Rhodovulum sp. DZ06]|uniref:alpha-hydroxy acid oxidase n=1 Tax=Rhodovulum sp. DZ06 TaxID=3425126 RepID=UPI003D347175